MPCILSLCLYTQPSDRTQVGSCRLRCGLTSRRERSVLGTPRYVHMTFLSYITYDIMSFQIRSLTQLRSSCNATTYTVPSLGVCPHSGCSEKGVGTLPKGFVTQFKARLVSPPVSLRTTTIDTPLRILGSSFVEFAMHSSLSSSLLLPPMPLCPLP